MKKCDHRGADFPVCCIAGFQTRRTRGRLTPADLEIGDTAGLETCAATRKQWPRWLARALFAGVMLLGVTVLAQDAAQAAAAPDKPDAAFRAIGFGVAAALAVGLSILGAGYAVGRIGSAAVGALVEKPELLPRTILFIALGEGLAVLGFAFAMMLLQKI